MPQCRPGWLSPLPGARLHPGGTEVLHPERPGCLLLLGDHPGPHGQGRGPAEIGEWPPASRGAGASLFLRRLPHLSSSGPWAAFSPSWWGVMVAEGGGGEGDAHRQRQRPPSTHLPAGRGAAALLAAAHPVVARARAVPQQGLHQQPGVWHLRPRLREAEGPGGGHPGPDAGGDGAAGPAHWGPCRLSPG